jgi:ATP-dependent RNA helicase DeaD
VVAVYGGEQMALQIAKLKRGVDVIVATPGRLIDLTKKGNINFESIKVVCLD